MRVELSNTVRLDNKFKFGNSSSAKNVPQAYPPPFVQDGAKVSGSEYQAYLPNISFGTSNVDTQYRNKYLSCRKIFTPEAEKLFNHAAAIASKSGASQIDEDHLFLAGLYEIRKFMDELDEGASYVSRPTFFLSAAFEYMFGSDCISDSSKRKKLEPIIDHYIKSEKVKLKQRTNSNPPQRSILGLQAPLKPSKTLLQTIATMFDLDTQVAGGDAATVYTDCLLYQSLFVSRNREFAKTTRNFMRDIQKALMTSPPSKTQALHLKFYDEKADKLWKNLDLGNDMFILYDDENSISAKHLISSFTNLINKKQTPYKNLNKENTEITVLNSDSNFDFFNDEVERAKKDTEKTHIFIVPFYEAVKNTAIARKLEVTALDDTDQKTIKNKPNSDGKSNIRIVFIASKDVYFANMKAPGIKDSLARYGQISIPMVNADDAKEMLKDATGKAFIKDKTKKSFDDDAIDRAVDIAKSKDGYFPEKAIQFMTAVASYNIDSETITVDDIDKYLVETSDISSTGEVDSEFQLTFDTGKTLDDIVGSPMTKAEAKSVVTQILNKTAGTRGMTVFLDNGTSYGGGRRHTAEAIAGEAGIPMITINARDFALKDIDALSQNAGLSEIKIKKLVSLAKSQAEANKNKTAMIFIENFDNFGCYGYGSIYEQKAFSQLLREMDNVRKNDNINLLIVGSTNDPESLDVDIMKPYKFLDRIIIYSPQDSRDRVDILNYYIEKNGLQIAGDTDKERAEIVKNIADTTQYFTVVDLMYLLDKAMSISKELGKDAIDKNDFVEAFLQTTTGRVSTREQPEHDKEIVAAHECGHGLTLQIMYNLAEKSEKPWHLPDQLNFITLDPRGNYGGCMYPKDSKNDEYSFEKLFADIVCSFGGHSSEHEFYNMDGSWGITQDMRQATASARLAVESMGLGPKTGRVAIPKNALGMSEVPERVKNNIYDDMELFLKNANYVSDSIVHAYAGFVQEFAQKYKDRVGTGNCVVTSDEFKAELDSWKSRQDAEKLQELDNLEQKILEVIKKTKNGELVNSVKK